MLDKNEVSGCTELLSSFRIISVGNRISRTKEIPVIQINIFPLTQIKRV